jgi:FdhD protein
VTALRDRPGNTVRARVHTFTGGVETVRRDDLATEEPLEIRIATPSTVDRPDRTVAVTMRTPGADFELAAGFLYGEGVIAGPDDLLRIGYCTDPRLTGEQRYNVVTATLAPDVPEPDLRGLERHFLSSAACGVCGKASLEALAARGLTALPPGPAVELDVLYRLPDELAAAQRVFGRTGGLHAAGLFTVDGQALAVREDIGRHNAVDKLVGWALSERRLPARELVLLVSGRAGYEIVQKAAAAGIPVVAAVSAPSSLAVDLAVEYGLTLVGFLRGERCNVYAGRDRLVAPAGTR